MFAPFTQSGMLAACLCVAPLSATAFTQQLTPETADPPAAPRAAESATVERMMQMDQNGDGTLTPEETTGLMKRFFDRNDTNQDGKLDTAELKSLEQRLARGRTRQQSSPPDQRQGISNQRMIKDLPDDVVVEPNLTYRPGGSKAWRLDLIRPKAPSQTKRPGIVFVHGGGWRSGDKRSGYFLRGAVEYAQLGYVCITVNYRLTGEASFPASIEDVKCAVRWFRENAEKYNLDPERVGGYGNSAGAHLVSMLGLCPADAGLEGDGPYQQQSSLLQAVCASATPADLSWFPNMPRAGGPFPGDKEERMALIKKCSPLHHVNNAAPPFLLVHGTGDRTVDIKHGDQLAEALKTAGADVTYIRIDSAGHGVFNQHAKRTHPAMKDFFGRVLGD